MFDLGWQEMFLVAVLTLMVVGPKEIPKVLRTVSKLVKQGRSLVGDFRSSVGDVIREAELDEIKNQVTAAGHVDLKSSVENIIDPGGDVSGEFELDDKTRRAVAEMNGEDDDAEIGPDVDVAKAPEPEKAAPKKTEPEKTEADKA
ncbi:Sec-independent protein translocase protein TatB [Magnetospira sp. QH-2]|uniref:Sec-independent protein translocase protein TatB n=1 Tax=Magnetospira sp. (strain QH-2) TaxID=1288970 RepID=UPI0003E80E6F|nr:Sec-independent protein translocase protein TatB [Magnetospira sp. QH-2]CCQ73630.1 TatABCE protein translocation system subunit TatB [Magnetospira sp. QH-2]